MPPSSRPRRPVAGRSCWGGPSARGWPARHAPSPQDDASASLTRPFRREDARLDPGRPAADLERQVRANDPWPGTFIETDDGRLLVTVASVAPSEETDVPGRIVRHGDRPALATAAGRLVLDAVQVPGRRQTTGPDFLRGRAGIIGRSVVPGP